MIKIGKLNELDSKELKEAERAIRDIFFLSSSLKEFSSPERKEAFFKRWCGDYFSLYPEQFYFMREEDKFLGYLSSCRDSKKAIGILEVPGYLVFADLFDEYACHFHINFHPDCRGRGLGSELVERMCDDLKKEKIAGVHLVTTPDAANVRFYQRLGFHFEVKREFNQMTLLFMGRILE
ncbi:MAG: GNAT family N-acetyltransferase [Bacteriovorax sp.]